MVCGEWSAGEGTEERSDLGCSCLRGPDAIEVGRNVALREGVRAGSTWGCSTAFSITVSTEGDTQVVTLAGELDLLGADRVRTALTAVTGATLVADLSELTFIDARGVSALVDAEDEIRARGSELHIVGATGLVRRVFEICGLDDRLG